MTDMEPIPIDPIDPDENAVNAAKDDVADRVTPPPVLIRESIDETEISKEEKTEEVVAKKKFFTPF